MFIFKLGVQYLKSNFKNKKEKEKKKLKLVLCIDFLLPPTSKD